MSDECRESPASTFPTRLADVIGSSSVRAFARRAGVSDTFLRQCLAGRTEPTRTKLLAICRAGGVSVEWLATGSGDRSHGAAGSLAVAEPGPPDREALTSVIEMLETVLDHSGRTLAPAEKSRLIMSLYDLHTSHGPESVSAERVRELLHFIP